MQTVDLGGQWVLKQAGTKGAIPAAVPGCVHTDLLAAKKIDDPLYRDNEEGVQWIGEADWIYSRRFDVPGELLHNDRVLLRCEGLDTLAAIRINGEPVAKTDNMFRTWEFDVKRLLRAGENTIEVRFESAVRHVEKITQRRRRPSWKGPQVSDPRALIRKEPCNFGWDWGPRLVTCGIWRDIGLVALGTARLTDLHVAQDHSRRGEVKLAVTASAEVIGKGGGLTAAVAVTHGGRTVAHQRVDLKRGKAEVHLTVKNPKLWWPSGMGDQPLHEVTVDLLDSTGGLVDTTSRRVGLRTLRLVRKKDKWGESFHFEANGTAFFAKGANWIPADTFATRMTRDRYADLLGSAAEANMNMLRVWGGGVYEDDAFYDLADELGICIWQDFMFSCSTYPTFDEAFLANVRAEAVDNIRRIHHHPCLALWCGNNELEQGMVAEQWTARQMSWADYSKLFDRMLPEIVRREDPGRDYWPSSPHSPYGDRRDHSNPARGDAHLWGVWHGRQPFEWYRTCTHRFNSEFGFQSFPAPRTVRAFTAPADRNVTSPIMEHHQRSHIGNAAIIQYMLDWFRLPAGFEMALWASQVLQGMAMKYAVEHWRRSMPRGMGTLYWQLNDCWGAASWASIDYYGRWKALHYMARRFFAPVLLSAVEDVGKGIVELHVTSDLLRPQRGRLTWTLTDVAGNSVAADTSTVRIAPSRSARALKIDLADPLKCFGPRGLLLWMDLSIGGETVSTNLVTFVRPKHLDLLDPQIRTSVKGGKDGTFLVTLRSKRPALWVWVELSRTDARYSDNFFHLRPGEPVTVEVTPDRPMKREQFAKQLRVRSLVDTYRE